jgi:hypothetical protein
MGIISSGCKVAFEVNWEISLGEKLCLERLAERKCWEMALCPSSFSFNLTVADQSSGGIAVLNRSGSKDRMDVSP